MPQNMCLADLLQVRPGITALVGAGGKTTAMLTLAEELAGRGERVIVTTTTHIFPPDPARYGPGLPPEDEQAIRQRLEQKGLAVVTGPLDERGKCTGLADGQLEQLLEQADCLLVEADGSRRLPCKAPGEREPALPARTGQVIGVLGLSCLGQTLEAACFRVEIAARQLGVPLDAVLTPELLGRIGAAEWGLAKHTQGRRFSVLLNQKDTCGPDALRRVVETIRAENGAQIVSAALQKHEWNEE